MKQRNHTASLPTSLKDVARVAWAGQPHRIVEPFGASDITIVTAFFDIGRDRWLEDGAKKSRFRRSAEDYMGMFAHLAKLKNQMVVFTEPRFVERVLELRRENGLEDRTSIVEIPGLFECGLIAPVCDAIERRMTDLFRHWVIKPESPEYREPRYVLVNALKSAFACTALELGLVSAPQIAWIDFGYCRDDRRFDPAIPWRFDTGGKMNLFHILELDDTPIYRVVRYGSVYFQGCHIVGPASAWPAFSNEMSFGLSALLASDLIDDDQTLLLMAWRSNPDNYAIQRVSSSDWYIIFQRFCIGASEEEMVKLQVGPRVRIESPLMEELRVALKQVEKSFKKNIRRPLRVYRARFFGRSRLAKPISQ